VAVAAEEQLEQEAATAVEGTATGLTEKIAETLETRKGNEKAALDEIVGMHESAADEASNAWKQVDAFAGASDRTSRDESKWSKGGTVTSSTKGSSRYGEGFIDYTQGYSGVGNLATMSSSSNNTSANILAELKKMNSNQQKLLTYN
jgi:hypothetical protein